MNGWDANVFDRRIFRLLKNQVHSVASNFIFAFFEFLLKLQIMRFALGWNEPIQLHFHKFNMKWKRCVHFFALMWPIFQIEIFNEICVNLLWLILSNKLNSEYRYENISFIQSMKSSAVIKKMLPILLNYIIAYTVNENLAKEWSCRNKMFACISSFWPVFVSCVSNETQNIISTSSVNSFIGKSTQSINLLCFPGIGKWK